MIFFTKIKLNNKCLFFSLTCLSFAAVFNGCGSKDESKTEVSSSGGGATSMEQGVNTEGGILNNQPPSQSSINGLTYHFNSNFRLHRNQGWVPEAVDTSNEYLLGHGFSLALRRASNLQCVTGRSRSVESEPVDQYFVFYIGPDEERQDSTNYRNSVRQGGIERQQSVQLPAVSGQYMATVDLYMVKKTKSLTNIQETNAYQQAECAEYIQKISFGAHSQLRVGIQVRSGSSRINPRTFHGLSVTLKNPSEEEIRALFARLSQVLAKDEVRAFVLPQVQFFEVSGPDMNEHRSYLPSLTLTEAVQHMQSFKSNFIAAPRIGVPVILQTVLRQQAQH